METKSGPSGNSHEPGRTGQPLATAMATLFGLFRTGRHAEVESLAQRLLESHPESIEVLCLLGASRLSRGLLGEAEQALAKANRLAPGDAQTLGLLGVTLYRLGRHDEARSRFENSLRLQPASYETLVNAAANEVAAGNAEAALSLATRALSLRPNGVEAWLNMGNALMTGGRSEDGADAYRRAIALLPDAADVHLNLGNALFASRRFSEAAASLRQVLTLNPGYAAAHLNLGRTLHELGDTGTAQHHFWKAAQLDPSSSEANSAYLFALLHDPRHSREHVYLEHLRIGDLMEAPYRSAWRGHANDRDPERALRIGYVSGDLHDHPVANLIEPIWRAMRHGRNQIFAYANGARRDAAQARLRALAHEWVQVERMNDDELAERIRADAIDILFDLSGHTARNRLLAFARKPAPIQVSWIGYPGTTGLSAMDYRFVRDLSSQGSAVQPLFREKLVAFRARGFDPAPEAPEVNPLPALQTGRLTFGSFNRPSKLGEAVIALWSRVLLAVPDSRLLVAGVDESVVKERLGATFAAHGVEAHRLEFRPRVPVPQYLAMHHDVDLALDTFPYTGGTTTYHALWMGVPVLTLTGPSLQQNQAASVLGSLGLSDWVTANEEEFVEKARRVAADLPALGQLRSSLRSKAEKHFVAVIDQTAREMDSALRTIWRRWCAGQEPSSFDAQA